MTGEGSNYDLDMVFCSCTENKILLKTTSVSLVLKIKCT